MITATEQSRLQSSREQVLNLQPTDIGDLSSLISFSTARTYTTISYKSGGLATTYSFRFPVDETTTAVLLSVNGRSIQVTVRNSQGWLLYTASRLGNFNLCGSQKG